MRHFREHMGGVLGSVCEIVVGVLLLVNPARFTAGIIVAAGLLLALAGVVSMVRYFRAEPRMAAREQALAKGLLALMAGLFCMFRSGWFIATFPVLTILYGVSMLVAGVGKVQWTVDMLRMKRDRWYLAAVSAAASLICAAVILANPFAGTVALWMFIGIALIAEAIVDLLALLWRKKEQ